VTIVNVCVPTLAEIGTLQSSGKSGPDPEQAGDVALRFVTTGVPVSTVTETDAVDGETYAGRREPALVARLATGITIRSCADAREVLCPWATVGLEGTLPPHALSRAREETPTASVVKKP